MSEETTLKKLGLKHMQNAERLDYLVKIGLKRAEVIHDGFRIVIVKNYKQGPSVTDAYDAPTLCEALDKAWEVHGHDDK